MSAINKVMDILQQDLNKFKSNMSKYIVQEIADDLTNECKNAIADFYAQYDPEDPSNHHGRVYYYRHWNFKKSFKRFYKNHNPRYIGGVELLEDSLPNVYTGKNSDTSNVFWRVYSGLHGIASIQGYVPSMKMDSPYNRLINKQQEIIKNKDKYFNNAFKKAENDSYNVIF